MTSAEAEAVLARSCEGKQCYSPSTAMEVAKVVSARAGQKIRAYRCPLHGGSTWHVGHLPDLDSLQTLAEAMRVAAGCAPAPAGLPSASARRRLRRSAQRASVPGAPVLAPSRGRGA